MNYKAIAKIKNKITASAAIKHQITVQVSYPVMTSTCPQYNLLDGGTPSWIYQPIGSFDLVSGGNP